MTAPRGAPTPCSASGTTRRCSTPAACRSSMPGRRRRAPRTTMRPGSRAASSAPPCSGSPPARRGRAGRPSRSPSKRPIPTGSNGSRPPPAAVCEASGVELAGGDTTRGPGRATVFALATEAAFPHPPEPEPRTARAGVRLSLAAADAPEHAPTGTPEQAIADLVSVCTDLAGRGTEIRWCDVSNAKDGAGEGTRDDTRALELIARTDDRGMEALRATASRHRFEFTPTEADARAAPRASVPR